MELARRRSGLKTLALLIVLLAITPGRSSCGEVAVVLSDSSESIRLALEGFREALPGQQIKVYNIEGAADEVEPFFDGIESQSPSMILTLGLKASLAARKYVDDLPVIFTMASHAPPRLNLRKDNMTGVSESVPPEKIFTLIKTFIPNVSRVGVIYNPANSGDLVKAAIMRASEERINLISSRVDSVDDMERAFRLFKKNIDVFWLIPDSMIISPGSIRNLIKFTLRNKIPLVAYDSLYIRANALLSIEADPSKLGAQAAGLAKRVLVGESPESIEVESPNALALGLNVRTARKIGRVDDIAINALIYAADNKLDVTVVK